MNCWNFIPEKKGITTIALISCVVLCNSKTVLRLNTPNANAEYVTGDHLPRAL